MCSCDWDPPEFCREVLRVARKAHKCYECAREIKSGEQYQYVIGKWDGSLCQFKICIGCFEGIKWLSMECGCRQYGSIGQDLMDHFYDGQSSWKLGRLIVSMGQRWTRTDGSLLPVPA